MKKLVMFCAISCVAGVGLVYFDRMSAKQAKGSGAADYKPIDGVKAGGSYKIGQLLDFIKNNNQNASSNFIFSDGSSFKRKLSEDDKQQEVTLLQGKSADGKTVNKKNQPMLYFEFKDQKLYLYDPNVGVGAASAKNWKSQPK